MEKRARGFFCVACEEKERVNMKEKREKGGG